VSADELAASGPINPPAARAAGTLVRRLVEEVLNDGRLDVRIVELLPKTIAWWGASAAPARTPAPASATRRRAPIHQHRQNLPSPGHRRPHRPRLGTQGHQARLCPLGLIVVTA